MRETRFFAVHAADEHTIPTYCIVRAWDADDAKSLVTAVMGLFPIGVTELPSGDPLAPGILWQLTVIR